MLSVKKKKQQISNLIRGPFFFFNGNTRLSPLAVTNYNTVVDGGSDSDDEDKLQIVEADGGLVEAADSTLPEDEAHCSDGGEGSTCSYLHDR